MKEQMGVCKFQFKTTVRGTCERHTEISRCISRNSEGLVPRVEDSHVVVASNGSHQSSDGQGNTVLLVNITDLNPEENGSCSHGSNAKGQRIVHCKPLAVGHIIWKGRHDEGEVANKTKNLMLNLE